MFVFEYNHTNYDQLVQDYARQLGVPVINNKFIFPRNIAIGFMQAVDLQSRLQAIIFDYTFTDKYIGKRKKSTEEYYTLWFNEITIEEGATIEIETEQYKPSQTSFSAVLLTSTLFDAVFEAEKGTRIFGINILLSKEWLADHLGVNDDSELLRKYLSLKASRITLEPIDAEYKKLINEIINLVQGDEQFKQIAVQNRIMLLIERFFMRMALKMQDEKNNVRLSREDINRVMQVEALLTKDVFKLPPFISDLAKMVHVSETKLKKNFKSVYGFPIYHYYQKARMHVAKEVLETQRYSIKQIAQEMGYSNLSNFTIAFKKEFGMLPSELQ